MHDDETTTLTTEHTHRIPEEGTIRVRANAKRTAKDGWMPSETTVEIAGPLTGQFAARINNLVRDETVRLHDELAAACAAMNRSEGR